MTIGPDRASVRADRAVLHTWSASLLPALAGSILPGWLMRPDANLRWLDGLAFCAATLLVHAGFLQIHLATRGACGTPRRGARRAGGIALLVLAAGLGAMLQSRIQLRGHAFVGLFLAFGGAAGVTGLLYTTPPVALHRRVGGEVVLSVGLGMLPVLGAYVVQVGDLTRTVYLASMPIVAATALWVWVGELRTQQADAARGIRTMPMLFSAGFAERVVPLLLVGAVYGALVLAVLGRASTSPLSLSALLSLPIAARIVRWTRAPDAGPESLLRVERHAKWLHGIVCVSIILPSVAQWLRDR